MHLLIGQREGADHLRALKIKQRIGERQNVAGWSPSKPSLTGRRHCLTFSTVPRKLAMSAGSVAPRTPDKVELTALLAAANFTIAASTFAAVAASAAFSALAATSAL